MNLFLNDQSKVSENAELLCSANEIHKSPGDDSSLNNSARSPNDVTSLNYSPRSPNVDSDASYSLSETKGTPENYKSSSPLHEENSELSKITEETCLVKSPDSSESGVNTSTEPELLENSDNPLKDLEPLSTQQEAEVNTDAPTSGSTPPYENPAEIEDESLNPFNNNKDLEDPENKVKEESTDSQKVKFHSEPNKASTVALSPIIEKVDSEISSSLETQSSLKISENIPFSNCSTSQGPSTCSDESLKINYLGYKKPYSCETDPNVKLEVRINSKGNPFNPSWKRDHKPNKGPSISNEAGNNSDAGTSLPEYTHYLGLQPTINFRCNHCGTSGFDSIHSLNVHQVECRKAIKHSTSTNIKFTRKVYLCSVCGTYYNSCYLFYHMREKHEKFICLHCLAMFPNSEKLREHLTIKHQINYIHFSDSESFKKCNIPTYFLLCLECDAGLSEKDDFKHVCSTHQVVHSVPTSEPVALNVQDEQTENRLPSQISQSDETKTAVISKPDKLTKSDTVNKAECEISCQVTDGDSHTVATEPEVCGDVKGTEEKEEVSRKEEEATDIPDTVNDDPSHNLTSESIHESTHQSVNISENKTEDSENVKNEEEFVKTVIPPVKPVKRVRKGGRQQAKKKKRSLKQIVCETLPPSVAEPDSALMDDATNEENELSKSVTSPKTDENSIKSDKKPILWKPGLDKNLMKFKLQSEMESDEESDDSNKLSMVIDETPAASDNDSKGLRLTHKGVNNSSDDSNQEKDVRVDSATEEPVKSKDDIQLAGDDVPAMALTLDSKVEEIKVQHILKECVRTSCLSCNYCRRAVKIAVNGKQLALHLLSEHRYTPVKNDTPDDVINKLKSSLEELGTMYFNTESYDSTDQSIHVPYDKDNTFDCFQCNYVTNSHKDLYIHKRKSHTKSLLLCIMCKSNFYSYSELLCHLCPGNYNPNEQLINIDINYRCCFCQLDTIPSAFRLMVHLRKCHHTCDICLEICSDQQKLSTHMWKHKLNHLCYRCGIAYASKPDITKHLFWKHGTESVLCKKCLQKKWPHVYHFCIPPTSFICEECNSSFSKAVALKVHKRIHSGDISYKCSQCEKKFISKKLLTRHEARHNLKISAKESNRDDKDDSRPKEEIIDVTGVGGENPDVSSGSISADMKESDKDSDTNKHKKHKRDKKAKPVIDVYDLPPLNLSSDSDSSDEGGSEKPDTGEKTSETLSQDNLKKEEPKTELDDKPSINEAANETPCENIDVNPEAATDKIEENHTQAKEDSVDKAESSDINQIDPSNSLIKLEQANEVENIWENFYKTNYQNKNLPYPLCAMKTEIAYGIIMGDHNYCQEMKFDPIIKEDIPTNLDGGVNEGKSELLESENNLPKEDTENPPLPDSSPKKKQKSPKKKMKNNSSSSSDSSSDSDSTSCSCGPKCSCSSSSSDSSSSSSSDSDSSASDGKQKSDKRKKRKERKNKTKAETSGDQSKDIKVELEAAPPAIPEDPAVRESELETDETTTDEEFYDRQPQKIANQMLAEKRNQLMLLASVAPVNNGSVSPVPAQEATPPVTPSVIPNNNNDILSSTQNVEQPTSKKKVPKTRRKRSMVAKGRQKAHKVAPSGTSQAPEPSPAQQSYKAFTPHKTKDRQFDKNSSRFLNRNFPAESSVGSGSENESVRASKRRRIPNKFYGYSSGEEEEKMTPSKWRKQDAPVPPPPPPPIVHKIVHTTPQTPRIQLSLPKQIIRKPSAPKFKQYSSSNSSSDSESDEDMDRFSQQKVHQSIADIPKADKNVYCYCRCPYDEVSEMIACDDENCKIEWFHFECVGILVPPKGQWFCPECKKKRGIPG